MSRTEIVLAAAACVVGVAFVLFVAAAYHGRRRR